MKSEIIIKETEEEQEGFPLWAKFKDTNKVVCFTSEKEGVVIALGSCPYHHLFQYFDDWISCFNEDDWEIIPKGTLNLIIYEK